jgi:histone acetyltransferase (RNA polymerase elongator complex component)
MSRRKKHRNIPVFIPEEGCPHRCVFCNQANISGRLQIPGEKEVRDTILAHLSTLNPEVDEIEIAFFGGNFTGLPAGRQTTLLNIANEFTVRGLAGGIRLSTRPDYITDAGLQLLGQYPVKVIELGIQSFDDRVLSLSGRGHTVAQSLEAIQKVKAAGFGLVLQMMTGLPGDTGEGALSTACGMIAAGADATRIYPCVVIAGTPLETAFRNGTYVPHSLEDAARLAARLIQQFENAGVEILRVGLHPSDSLVLGKDLIAGPFHPAFREIAETYIWEEILQNATASLPEQRPLHITTAPEQLPRVAGYKKYNRQWLESRFTGVKFSGSTHLQNREFTICHY